MSRNQPDEAGIIRVIAAVGIDAGDEETCGNAVRGLADGHDGGLFGRLVPMACG